jgi:hypothetical protein
VTTFREEPPAIAVRPRSVAAPAAAQPILAIDPGTTRSAWLTLVDGAPYAFGILDNDRLLGELRDGLGARCSVVIEQVESYGMAVGREVFETVRWAGRFEEAVHQAHVVLMPRRTVKLAVCGDSRAKDANIRQALIDRFGGPDAIRKGGQLHGIAKDVWSALAIAVTHHDQLREGATR